MTSHQVNILFFSLLRDITGTAEIKWTLDPQSTLGDLLEQLYTRWPDLRPWDTSLLLAINQHYANRDSVIPANAEIAIMPPVQGG